MRWIYGTLTLFIIIFASACLLLFYDHDFNGFLFGAIISAVVLIVLVLNIETFIKQIKDSGKDCERMYNKCTELEAGSKELTTELSKKQQELIKERESNIKLRYQIKDLEWQIENPAKFKKGQIIGPYEITAAEVKEQSFTNWICQAGLSILIGGMKDVKPRIEKHYEYTLKNVVNRNEEAKSPVDDEEIEKMIEFYKKKVFQAKKK